MSKKVLSFVMALCMLLSMVPASFAETTCEHLNAEYVSATAGSHTKTCSDCGGIMNEECTYVNGVCEYCEVACAEDHASLKGTHDETAMTCTTDCDVCDYTATVTYAPYLRATNGRPERNHAYFCNQCEVQLTAYTNAQLDGATDGYEAHDTEATCAGSVCKVCKYVVSAEGATGKHKVNADGYYASDATGNAVVNGMYHGGICNICGQKFTTGKEVHNFGDSFYADGTPAIDYMAEVVEDGVHYATCTHCDFKVEIAQCSARYYIEAEAGKHIGVCNPFAISGKGHNLAEVACEPAADATVACGSKKVCGTCRKEYGEDQKHDYVLKVYTEDTAKHAKQCSVCDDWAENTVEEHAYYLQKDGSSKCACGAELKNETCEKVGHVWKEGIAIDPSCAKKINGTAASKICTVCGTIEVPEDKTVNWTHKLKEEVITQAYCETDGKVRYYCVNPGCDFETYVTIDCDTDARAHKLTKFVGWVDGIEPDCDTDGYKIMACECGWTNESNEAVYTEIYDEQGEQEANFYAANKQYVKVARLGHKQVTKIASFDADEIAKDKNGKEYIIAGATPDTENYDCEKGAWTFIGCSVDGCNWWMNAPTKVDNTVFENHTFTKNRVKLDADKDCTVATALEQFPNGIYLASCSNTPYCTVTEYTDYDGTVYTADGVAQIKALIAAESHVITKDYNKDGVVDWEDYIHEEISALSCTVDGEYVLVCPICETQVYYNGEKYVTSTKNYIVKAAGQHTNDEEFTKPAADSDHVVEGWMYVEPTCQNRGYWISYCSLCNKNEVIVYDDHTACAQDHNYVVGAYVDTELVCGEPANRKQVCEFCGKVKVDANGRPELVEDDAVDHIWVPVDEYDVVPTCSQPGKGLVECTRCGKVSYEDNLTVNYECSFVYAYKEPTCLEPSMHGWYCEYCGAKKGTDLDKGTVEVTPAKPALGHKLDYGTKVDICGYAEDVYMQKCQREGCDYVVYTTAQTDTVIYRNMDAGVEVKDATAREEVDEISNQDHAKANDWVVTKAATCTEYGLKETGFCTKCDWKFADYEIEVIKAEHTAGTDVDGNQMVNIVNCQGVFKPDYYCTVCGEYVKAEKVETLAQYIKGLNSSIKDVDDLIEAMLIAGTIESVEDFHANLQYHVINAASCTKQGLGVAFCADCNWQAEEASIIPFGHTWSEDVVVTVAPTCKTVGYGKRVCTVCGADKPGIVTIPTSGIHTFEKKLLNSNTCEKDSYVIWACSLCGAADIEGVKAATGLNYIQDGVTFYKLLTGVETYSAAQMEKLDIVQGEDGLYYAVSHIDTAIEVAGDGAATHTFGEEEYREATCEFPAGIRATCKKCGWEKVVRADAGSEALGHDYFDVVVKATCFSDGYAYEQCFRCDYIDPASKTVSKASGHDLVLDKKDARYVAATCSTYGTDVLKCANKCGYEVLETSTYNTTDAGHKWVTVLELKAATCTTTGLARQKCELCDVAIKVNVLPAKHSWVKGDVIYAPTCADVGLQKVTCSVCKKNDTMEMETIAHVMVQEVTAATCTTEAGIMTKCKNCNRMTSFLKTGSTVLGHKWSEKTFTQPTCTKDGGYTATCLREGCTATHLEVAKNGNVVLYPKFDHQGKKLVKTIDATCQSGKIKIYECPICKEEVKVNDGIENRDGHDWKITATYNDNITCKTPGYVDRICNLCKKTETEIWHIPAHTWTEYFSSDDCIYRFCLVCGTIDSEWVSPTFKGFDGCALVDYDIINGTAVKVLVGAHKGLVVEENVAATCTTAGYIGKIACTTCGMVIQEHTVIPAHTLRVEPAVAATCTADGKKEATYCTVCDKYVVAPEVVPMTGHTEVEVPETPATAYAPGVAAGKKCTVCGVWTEGGEEIAQLKATIKRLCALRSKAADYRDDNTSVLLGMLDTIDDVVITGELNGDYYPVDTELGEGFIHYSYLTVTAA